MDMDIGFSDNYLKSLDAYSEGKMSMSAYMFELGTEAKTMLMQLRKCFGDLKAKNIELTEKNSRLDAMGTQLKTAEEALKTAEVGNLLAQVQAKLDLEAKVKVLEAKVEALEAKKIFEIVATFEKINM